MNIFIIGGERCGKSTAAQHLAKALGCDFAETGRPVIRELAKLYASSKEPDRIETWEKLIRIGKSEFRSELATIGDLMTKLAPTCLIEHCCKRARIVVGVRRRREVLSFFQAHGRNVNEALWIKIVASQPLVVGSNFELQDQPCDYEVVNDGDYAQLEQKVNAVASKIQAKASV